MLSINKKINIFIITMNALMMSNVLIAADFTFNVPVNFTNLLDDVDNVKATCKVIYRTAEINREIGKGSTYEPVNNGIINKTITVSFDSVSGNDPALANKWSCDVEVCISNGLACSNLRTLSAYESKAFEIAPGTTAIMYRSGNL